MPCCRLQTIEQKVANGKFALTRIYDVLHKMGRAKYFSVLAVTSSFYFQRMLIIALSDLDAKAFLYVDDIIVFGCSLKHHNDNLIDVFA